MGNNESLSFKLFQRGEPGFDNEVKIWNDFAQDRRRPKAVAVCSSSQHVQQAVRFAIENRIPLSVRGGGHNVAGLALRNDGLCISLARMRNVAVDVEKRTARCDGGCLGSDVDMATGKHHLYVAGIGLISTTGIGGLVTGGGVGWLSRRYGLAIDSLLSVDIVTASGELLLNVCETNEAYRDLFFAVRGGGSNFGIVVSFTFRLVRVPFVVTRTQIVRSDDVQSAMARYGELLQSAPDSITSLGFLAGRSNKVAAFIVITTFVPDEDKQLADVEDALKCIEKFDLDGVSATRMTDVYEHLYELQRKFDEGNVAGRRYYWKSNFIASLSSFAALCNAAVDALTSDAAPSHGVTIEFVHFGGAIARHAGAGAGCFGHRAAPLEVHSICVWDALSRDHDDDGDEEEDRIRVEWSRGFGAAAARALGSNADSLPGNINILGPNQSSQGAYGAHFDRLLQIKRKYDPNNVFDCNHNIK